MKETDWNTYYQSPYKLAKITRKFTSNILTILIKRYGSKKKPFTVAELGGANSSFFRRIRKINNPDEFHVFDNNEFGLNLLEKKRKIYPEIKIHNENLLELENEYQFDLVYSIGLIEHFDVVGTNNMIKAHFDLLKPGGIAIIAFPTPTLVYRFFRTIAEALDVWIFHDERPLKFIEVENNVQEHGIILNKRYSWLVIFTQGILTIRKDKARVEG